MIFEKVKIASVAVSLGSIVFAVLGAANSLTDKPWLPNTLDALYVALAGAMASSFALLAVNRKMQKNRQPRRIFIAYSHKDQLAAKKISGLLREVEFDPWLYEENLLPGQDWTKEISLAISKSGAALVLLSENFYASQSAIKDLDRITSIIISNDKNIPPILPIRLDDSSVPSRLSGIHSLNWDDAEFKPKFLLSLSFITGQATNLRT